MNTTTQSTTKAPKKNAKAGAAKATQAAITRKQHQPRIQRPSFERPQIDAHVPIPPKTRSDSKYPFASMVPGQSFAIKAECASLQSIYQNARGYSLRHSNGAIKFRVRKVTEEGVAMIRCWRTA